jgi:hypothetical protein
LFVDDLVNRLAGLKADLDAEGHHSRFIVADVYDGREHQDGRTLLAMRDFLIAVRDRYPNLTGTLLIGSFPEATLVRRWAWKNHPHIPTINGVDVTGLDKLGIVPELIDHRADIVLGDLDGNWDRIYVQPSTVLSSVIARPDPDRAGDWWRDGFFHSRPGEYEVDSKTLRVEDFFWIRDDYYVPLTFSDGGDLWLYIQTSTNNPELAASDRTAPNPIARPEISVSRINPRHIAVNPDSPDLFDASGSPTIARGGVEVNWVRDAALEREILIDFLDRNHRFRVGGYSDLPFRAGAITYPEEDFTLDSLAGYVGSASTSFEPLLNAPRDPSLLEYVRWLSQPVLLRGVSSHSDGRTSFYGTNYNYRDLETTAGGRPWRWRGPDPFGYTFPTFAWQGGAADFFLHRTLWEYGSLDESGPSFFLHQGCRVNTPAFGHSQPHTHRRYGEFQNGESQLFFLNGLAMIARAKVFNDLPNGIDSVFRRGETVPFGELWHETFAIDADSSSLTSQYARNKKAYNWSVLGDWTLRLHYDNGFGLMTARGPLMENTHTHADRAWVEGWNFESAKNEVQAAGDFNADGVDEFLVTSSWGLGILGLEEGRWVADVVQPDGAWFGGWHFGASQNVIEGVGNFDGRGGDEILITSGWGLGILKKSGDTLTSVLTLRDNTFAGGWRYESANTIEAIADVNGDGKDDIVVTSRWGIGVLTLKGSSLTSLAGKPNGSRFGGWRYSSTSSWIEALGNFDGTGGTDLLVRTASGIAVLRQIGDTFRCIFAASYGTRLGSWLLGPRDVFQGVADFDGDRKEELLISSPWGVGVLEWNGTRLSSKYLRANGERMGAWRVNSRRDRFIAFGDFDGDMREDVITANDSSMMILREIGGGLSGMYRSDYGAKVGNWMLQLNDQASAVGNFDPDSRGSEWLITR